MTHNAGGQTVGDRIRELWQEQREMEEQIQNLQDCLAENRDELAGLVSKPMRMRLSAATGEEPDQP